MAEQQAHELYQALLEKYANFTGVAPAQPTAQQKLLTVCLIDAQLGPMIAIADDAGLHLLEFIDCRGLQREVERLVVQHQAIIISGTTPVQELLKQELAAYFSGSLQTFTTPLHVAGTQFQKSVWQELQKISYGQTRTYQQQAQCLGKPTASRAVANANGANQLAIIIPCHRIVMSSGKVGGYAGQVWRKQWLLNHEKNMIK